MACCNSRRRNDYCRDIDRCDPPFLVLPGPERCDKYSFPDCSLDCRRSESSEDDLRHLAKDDKFSKDFVPYLHRQCTVGTCTSRDDSESACCPRRRGPKRYSCCGGYDGGKHESGCNKYRHDSSHESHEYKIKHDRRYRKEWKQLMRMEKREHMSKKDHEGRKFTITLVDKKYHPQAHHIPHGAKVWAVNGYAGARLNLYEGNTYYFEIDVSCGKSQDFYLTADIMGGGDYSSLLLPGTVSVSEGVLCLRVDEHTPRCFYYQSMQGPHRGGMIIVSRRK